ncbi:MAG: response regulator [Gammaproteobacteria bacterium]|nr:response regulator [Gammaproteobacteria bacterium]
MTTILIADDRSSNREYLTVLLGYQNFKTLEAKDGIEALAVINDCHPDLVISDIIMPHMDGYELALKIKQNPEISHIPVIFYTAAYRVLEAEAVASACGVQYVIGKPADPYILLDVINKALAKPIVAPQVAVDIGASDPISLIAKKLSQKSADFESVTSRLASLIELGLDFAEERDPYQCLILFCNGARKLIASQYSAILIFESIGYRVHHFVLQGNNIDKNDFVAPDFRQGLLLADLFNKNRPTRLQHPIITPRELGLPDDNLVISNLLSIPISTSKGTMGLIYLVNKIGSDEFNEDDERMAAALAAEISVTYESIRLFEELKLRNEELNKEVLARNKAELMLYQSNKHFRDLIEYSPDAILIAVKDVIVYANPCMAKLFAAKDSKELLGKSLSALFQADDKEIVESILKKMNTGEIFPRSIAKCIRCDGVIIDTEVTASTCFYESSPANQVIIRDVTLRTQSENTLYIEFNIAKLMVEDVSVEEGLVAALSLIGNTMSQDLGFYFALDSVPKKVDCISVWHHVNSPIVKRISEFQQYALKKISDMGDAMQPYWLLDADPAFSPINPSGDLNIQSEILLPILYENKLLGVILLFSHDKVDSNKKSLEMLNAIGNQVGIFIVHKQSLEKLKSSLSEKEVMLREILAAEGRYRAIMENASCGIVIHTPEGILLESNKQTKKIFGQINLSNLGKTFADFIVPTDQEYVAFQFKKLAAQKSIGPIAVHVQHDDRQIIDVEFSSVYVESDNENYIISILNDTTESNRLLSQTLLSDKLATIGTLATGIIHEINNPLIWILNNLSYMKDKIKLLQPADDEKKNILLKLNETIDESILGAERIRDIVHDLKGFTRVDQNDLTPVDVNAAVKAAINMAYPQFKNVAKLETSFDKNLPILLLNSNKLQQIFLNLIVNAAQAINKKDYEENVIRVKTCMTKNQICIDITDTGTGIPPEVLSKIFNPFFTTKPVGVGTGLGLSISHEIIHSIGGDIAVQSILNVGTTFSVHLPLQLKMQAPSETASVAIIMPLKRKKILVIDDEPTLLKVIKQILSKNHDITVSDGRAALRLLVDQGENFDAMITDVNMPDVSGIDLYRYVANQYPGLEQRIIFVTGGDYTSTATEFLRSIKNPCLEKPFTPAQLHQAVTTIFSDGQ